MKSRITIEVDFENGNTPVIQILQASSDDVRDKLIKAFTEQLGGSSWCQIQWVGGATSMEKDTIAYNRINITPIPPSKLKEQSEIMLEKSNLNEKEYERLDYNMKHYHETGELIYNIHHSN